MYLPKGKRQISLKDGKEAQLEYLMRRFGPQVQRLAYYYLRDLYLAEDVAQEVFYRVYRELDKFRADSSYYTWIYRITVNLCRDYLRSAALRRLIPWGDSHALEGIGGKTEAMLEVAEGGEIFHKVMELPLKYRTVLALHYFQELSIREIAQVLGIAEGNVRTRLCRGRAMLKRSLEEEKGDG